MVNGQRVNKCKVRPGDRDPDRLDDDSPRSAEGTSRCGRCSRRTVATPIRADSRAPRRRHGGHGAGPGAVGSVPFTQPPRCCAGLRASARLPAPRRRPRTRSRRRLQRTRSRPSNPFGAGQPVRRFGGRIRATATASTRPGGSDFDPNQPCTYSMVKSGPDVHPDEVETHAAAVEVLVKWDTNTLHVAHNSAAEELLRR